MIAPEIQAELRQRFNPDGSDLRKMQLRMLDMLKYIDRICRENDIQYWLSSGTCLGAVRHGGFIPWDDDIDVEMLERDYIKFVQITRDDITSQFILQDHSNERFYRAPFAKLRDKKTKEYSENDKLHNLFKYQGCAIDIFPMRPSCSVQLAKLGFRIHGVILKLTTSNTKLLQNLSFPVFKFSKGVIFPILNTLSQLNAKGQLRHKIPNPFFKARFVSDIFPLVELNFEGVKLFVPGKYNDYLKKLYGDFENIPPIDKIHTHISKVDFMD